MYADEHAGVDPTSPAIAQTEYGSFIELIVPRMSAALCLRRVCGGPA
jgi:hypothetical protein